MISDIQTFQFLFLQIVLELHDVGNRLQDATDLLAANGFMIHTERDFPPQNVMLYGRKCHDSP